jgi:integrase
LNNAIKRSGIISKVNNIIIRARLTAPDKYTIYLDFTYQKKRINEYLKIHLSTLIKTKWKDVDRSNIRLAKEIAIIRSNEILKGEYAYKNMPDNYKVLDYFKLLLEKRRTEKSPQFTKWSVAFNHFKSFRGSDVNFNEVTPDLLERYKAYLIKNYKQNTASSYFTTLSIVFNTAYKNDLIKTNPMQKIAKIRQEKTERTFLTENELNKLINTECYNPIIKKAFIFSCYTGLRLQDVKALTKDDILIINDNYFVRFKAKKTGKTNSIKLHPVALQQILPLGDRIFDLLSYKHLRKHLKDWGESAGLEKKITFHVARHTFATLLLNKGVDIYTVKELLQHSNISTTEIYAKLLDKAKDEAIDKL